MGDARDAEAKVFAEMDAMIEGARFEPDGLPDGELRRLGYLADDQNEMRDLHDLSERCHDMLVARLGPVEGWPWLAAISVFHRSERALIVAAQYDDIAMRWRIFNGADVARFLSHRGLRPDAVKEAKARLARGRKARSDPTTARPDSVSG